MARIDESELSRLKTDISLLALVKRSGYSPIRQGKDYAIHCPFHEDKTPSCIISPESNLFHCFGCSAAGSVIDWVMKMDGLGFREAVEYLQREMGDSVVGSNPAPATNSKRRGKPLFNLDMEDAELLNQVIDYYHQTLIQSPEALKYLESRGIHDDGLIHQFKLGFANRTLGYQLPDRQTKAGQAIRSRLQAIGILRESGHEHFNGSLVVPVIDNEKVVEVYGRKILGSRLRKGTPQHTYLPGEHAGVWHSQALVENDEVILCESLIDAMSFWVNGFTHVTASYGTNGFTPHHLAAFKENNISKVSIAYDRDEAGNHAAEKLAQVLSEHDIEALRVLFPKGMDVNDYALKMSPPNKALGLALRSAQSMTTQNTTPTMPNTQPPLNEHLLNEHQQSSSKPPLPTTDHQLETKLIVTDNEVNISLGSRSWRIRGLSKQVNHKNIRQMKVNLLVAKDELVYVDVLDLYQARARGSFITQASNELQLSDEVIKKDLGQILLKLEALQDEQLQQDKPELPVHEMSEQAYQEAMVLLQDENIMARLLADFATLGVIGEEVNKQVAYLSCVSRLLDKPLAIIIQSSSAAGKSSLMDAVLKLIPVEARVHYSAMTGQSLFYMGETNLKHKILAIAEEAGAEQASYALKLLQSEGELTIASTGKDENSGELVTREYHVEGPVMLFLTTTAIDIDEELMNRCLVLSVNESRAQTQAIHAMQRQQQTLAGLLQSEDKKHIVNLHQNAQRLLKPLKVVNPFAERLTFLDDKTRTRRDHMKYLTLIQSIALLHQYQREVKTIQHQGRGIEYIEVMAKDIALANQLAHEVLGHSLDELPPQTRRLLKRIYDMVQQYCSEQNMMQRHYHFSRKEIRGFTGWSDFQVRTHLRRLVELEYVLTHRGQRGQTFIYELLYDGQGEDNQSFLTGLIDISTLDKSYDAKFEGVNVKNEGQKFNNKVLTSSQRVSIERPTSGKINGKKHYKTRDETSILVKPENVQLDKGNQDNENRIVV